MNQGYLKTFKKFDDFRQLIDVNNQEEFKQNLYLLTNKHKYGYNFTMTEFKLYEAFRCNLKSDLVIFLENNTYKGLQNVRSCHKFRQTLKILSPFGKCLTYLYRLNEMKLFLKLNQYFVAFENYYYEDYYENKFQAINRRFIIHSQDMLPILTDSDLSITDTTVNMRKGFSIKLTKFQFERLPKPYDTNCQMYGNSTRFLCLNECYFDGYMNSDIKCIPNSESLYTFVIEEDVGNRRKIFCESDDEKLIKYLNKNMKEKCDLKCMVSCDETYFNTDYEQVQSSGNLAGPIYKFILKDSYYRRIKYSPKMTFFILLIQMANIWSLWHGISFQQIFELFLRFTNFIEFIEVFSIIGKKIIIRWKLEKIILDLIEFKKKIMQRINIKVI